MKTTHIISGILLSSLTAPVAFAQSNQTPPLPRALSNGDFCTTIASIDNIEDFALDKLNKRSEKFELNAQKRMERRGDNTAERNEKQETRMQNFESRAEKLKSQATTDEQRNAIDKFLATLSSAEQSKQESIEALLKQTRDEVDALISDKRSTTTTGIAELQATIQTAFDKAKSDCASGVDSKTALATFKATLQSTHEAFRSNKAHSQIKEELKQTHESKKSEIKAIQEDFKTSIESAKAELTSTFPEVKLAQPNQQKGFFGKIKSWFSKNIFGQKISPTQAQ